MTNGEKIKEIFPEAQIEYAESDVYIWLNHEPVNFSREAWESNYSEVANNSTTKNDLGVDCISREQAIEWVDNLRKMDECFGNHKGDYYPLSEVIDRLQNVPSVTPQEPRWIPVSERLPEECTAVLIWCPDRKNIYCAYLEEKQWWIFGAHFQKVTLEVIAWMPLPKPYSEVEV